MLYGDTEPCFFFFCSRMAAMIFLAMSLWFPAASMETFWESGSRPPRAPRPASKTRHAQVKAVESRAHAALLIDPSEMPHKAFSRRLGTTARGREQLPPLPPPPPRWFPQLTTPLDRNHVFAEIDPTVRVACRELRLQAAS